MTGAKKCPICGKAQLQPFRPFCSDRCRKIDLGRWLNGAYAIPAVEPPTRETNGRPDEGQAWDDERG